MTASPEAIRPDDVDPGEPIRELSGFELGGGDELVDRVLDRIDEQQAKTHALELSFLGFGHLLLEYLRLALEALRGATPDKEDDR